MNRDHNSLNLLEDAIGYSFKDRNLLELALTHRSYLFENEEISDSNERLEFLGDAVLELIIREHLMERFPDVLEGSLTDYKKNLVNRILLAEKGAKLNLGNFLNIGQSEENTGGRAKTSIISDAYEALIGAIYLDGGHMAAKNFILDFHLSDEDEVLNSSDYINYKGKLLEFVQQNSSLKPTYDIEEESGPEHHKMFIASVSIKEEVIAFGKGRSKKEAEQEAAQEALIEENLSKIEDILKKEL
ncbi:ribonuclease III [bacterium]|nr:ribonuclease III [bacterium]